MRKCEHRACPCKLHWDADLGNSPGHPYGIWQGKLMLEAGLCFLYGKMRGVLVHEFGHGVELFNRAAFFEAHEALEDVWRAAPGPEKKFLQGLIQVAVALYHHRNGNLVGARSVLRRAFRNLSRYPEGFGGIQLASLLDSISDWQRALDESTPVPPLPKIVVGRQSSVVRKPSPRVRNAARHKL